MILQVRGEKIKSILMHEFCEGLATEKKSCLKCATDQRRKGKKFNV